MKKVLFLFCIFSASSLHANADIYLATGVLTAKPDTDAARDALQEDLIASNPEIYENQEFKSAYNTTNGFWDFIESAAQLLGQNGWSIYWDSFITLTHNRLTQHYIDYYSGVSKNHGADLSLQKEAYKASINAGNQVIVIAHSQGNFFTNEAYNSLSPCEQRSFYMLGTANPADHVSGMNEGRGALATLDNDPITFVPSSMSANIINSERFSIAGVDMAHYKFHFFEYYRNQNSVSKYKIDTFPEYAIHHYNENNSHTTTPVSGIIDIKLSWGNPSIHMNLQSEIGIKDISHEECSPLEHYYVASEEDISPGTYGVYVTNPGGADDSYLPQSVSLNIHTPGAAIVFDFNITAADMFNLGHVADVIITEDKKSQVVSESSIARASMKCYGECSGATSGTYAQYLYEIQSKFKQALLGPLSAATISLTKAEDFANSVPFYESSTSAGNSILTAGIFYFTPEALALLAPETYYVMSVMGGDDIDANDDGKTDTTPTPNLGSIHAVVHTDTLKNENLKVNILTEVAFVLTQEMMTQELNTTALQEKLDDISKRLLVKDVDKSGEIDYRDLLAWVPTIDKDKLRKPYATFYEPIVQKIYSNEAIYDDAYALAYEPFFRERAIKIDENASSGTIVAKVELELLNAEASYTLVEENDFFEILSDGTIFLKNGSALDHETNSIILLHVQATSIHGEVTIVKIPISLNNIPEFAPTLLDLTLTMHKDTKIGTVIGNILKDRGDTSLSAIEILSSSPFTVDYSGNIRVATSLLEVNSSSYALEAEASNAFGKSNRSHLNITFTAPVIHDTSLKVFDNSVSLSEVGILDIVKNGNPIETITLSGDGSSDFTIDVDGVIRVADGMTLQASRKNSYTLTIRVNNTVEATVTIVLYKRILASVDTQNYAESITLSADETRAYVADGYSGLQIIDVSDPNIPAGVSSLDTPEYSQSVSLSVDGTKAYVADGFSGLQIIDVSEPTLPNIIASVDTPSFATSAILSKVDTLVYVADNASGLQIIDVSNPTSPIIVASKDTPSYAEHIALSTDGTKAYIADGYSGLQIIDVSDPTVATILASIEMSFAQAVALSEDDTKAYVVDYGLGLQILDISNPIAPTILSSIDTLRYAMGVTLSEDGTRAYVADGYSGLQIIDVSDPTYPAIIASVDTPGFANSVALSSDGTKAYVADGSFGLQIIDVSGL